MLKRLKPVRTVDPVTRLLSRAEAKAAARVESDVTYEDDFIDALVLAAEAYLDGHSGILGRALITQTWEEKFSYFTGDMPLRVGPVQSIESVTYFDTDGVERTLDPAVYRLHEAPGLVYLTEVDEQSWPSTDTRDDAVTITYVAGYGDAVTDVPEPIRLAARHLVAHWFNNREAVVPGQMQPTPYSVQAILAPFRQVRSFY